MFPSQRTALRRLWRQGPLPVVLALVLLAAWVAPAQMQGPVAQAPQGLAVCGSPRFQAKAAELRRTIDWKPLSQDGLRAQGKLGSEGQMLADTVDQQREFWASDFTTSSGTFYTLTATCKAVGTHAYLYLEDGQTVAESVLTNIINEFDTTIYPTDTLRFGDEPNPGIDGDALVYLLLLDIRDGYTPGGTYVAGYFYALNEFANNDLPPEYRYSNEKEILYIDLNPATPGSPASYGTVAHEFEHMIHWNMDTGGDEETWVDEGCADLAQYLCDYGHPGSHLYTGSPSQPGFLEEPDHQLTLTGADWNSTPHILASYGAAYMWTLYLWEQYGPDAILALVDEEADGITGVSNALATAGESDDFEAVFRR